MPVPMPASVVSTFLVHVTDTSTGTWMAVPVPGTGDSEYAYDINDVKELKDS